ncbi:hypothetical protein AB6J30_002658 [Salmonella enterica]|nr:hypothetical protein CPT_Munch_030 [Salmonella phage Munch]
MSLYSLEVEHHNFRTKMIVSTDAKEREDQYNEVMTWAKGFYPAGTLLKAKWVSHETKLDFHSAIAGGYEGIKLL